jgi:hypothetical protein
VISLEDITPEYIAHLEDEKKNEHLEQLTRETVMELADSYHTLKYEFSVVETSCRIRAIRLRECGMDEKEIAELFQVRLGTVRRWLK